VNAEGIQTPPTLGLIVLWRTISSDDHLPFAKGAGTAKQVRPGEYELAGGWGGNQGEWAGKVRVYLEIGVPIKGKNIHYSATIGEVELEAGKAVEMRPQ
jgi:hypothetical protein